MMISSFHYIHCIPGRPECSGRTGNRHRRPWITDAVVEESKAVTRDAVHVPGRLNERVRTADSDHQRQGGPEQPDMHRDPTTRSTTTHVDRSTNLDVSGSSVRPSTVTALRRTVARHCDDQVPVVTSLFVHDVIRPDSIASTVRMKRQRNVGWKKIGVFGYQSSATVFTSYSIPVDCCVRCSLPAASV